MGDTIFIMGDKQWETALGRQYVKAFKIIKARCMFLSPNKKVPDALQLSNFKSIIQS